MIEDRWTSKGMKILREVNILANSSVYVGVLGADFDKPKEGGSEQVTLGQVAVWMEFGTATSAERSFIRRAFEEFEEPWTRECRKQVSRVLEGKTTAKTALNRIGSMMAEDVRDVIASVQSPALSEATIRGRRNRAIPNYSTKPLIDFGQLYNSITYRVEM